MKASLLIAAGVGIIATAVYYWKAKHKTSPPALLNKHNEQHHLTDVFSRAKGVVLGN